MNGRGGMSFLSLRKCEPSHRVSESADARCGLCKYHYPTKEPVAGISLTLYYLTFLGNSPACSSKGGFDWESLRSLPIAYRSRDRVAAPGQLAGFSCSFLKKVEKIRYIHQHHEMIVGLLRPMSMEAVEVQFEFN